MPTTTLIRRSLAAALLAAAVALTAPVRPSQAAPASTAVRELSIPYIAYNGETSHATVLVPASYDPQSDPPLPLVISPHGRGLDGTTNARLWGSLPALGSFAVVHADGMGLHLSCRYSWGAPLQIWWTRSDRVIVDSQLHSGLLVRRIRKLNPRAPLTVVVGTWRHTAVLRWDRSLPAMLVGLGLITAADA